MINLTQRKFAIERGKFHNIIKIVVLVMKPFVVIPFDELSDVRAMLRN